MPSWSAGSKYDGDGVGDDNDGDVLMLLLMRRVVVAGAGDDDGAGQHHSTGWGHPELQHFLPHQEWSVKQTTLPTHSTPTLARNTFHITKHNTIQDKEYF